MSGTRHGRVGGDGEPEGHRVSGSDVQRGRRAGDRAVFGGDPVVAGNGGRTGVVRGLAGASAGDAEPGRHVDGAKVVVRGVKAIDEEVLVATCIDRGRRRVQNHAIERTRGRWAYVRLEGVVPNAVRRPVVRPRRVARVGRPDSLAAAIRVAPVRVGGEARSQIKDDRVLRPRRDAQ